MIVLNGHISFHIDTRPLNLIKSNWIVAVFVISANMESSPLVSPSHITATKVRTNIGLQRHRLTSQISLWLI